MVRRATAVRASRQQLISETTATHTETNLPQECGVPRRFTLGDGVFAVAALAAGFAMVRQWTDPRWCAAPAQLLSFPRVAPSSARQVYHAVAVGGTWSIPFALAFTPVIVLARFLRRARVSSGSPSSRGSWPAP